MSPDRDDAGDLGAPPAELINLRGPAGPIEAIVYGGPDWRACERLVVALHGGPLSSWAFGYEPLFHRLSAAGVAVLAPNYRGSTGYGEEHLRAVIGDWGGPDLDDVLHLARSLDEDRQEEVWEAWAVEIKRRLRALDSGDVETIPGEQVIRDARKLVRKKRSA